MAMTFLAPVWLLGTLPWLVLTAWLLLGRRRRQAVPFLPLWQGAVASRKVRQAIHAPPLALLFALAAIVLTLLAAARPLVRVGRPIGERITIVVDCGAAMSAIEPAGSRFANLADTTRQPLLDSFGPGHVDLIEIPRGVAHATDRDHWPEVARTLQPTGLDTSHLLRAGVAAILAERSGPVVVLSDHPCGLTDERLIVIQPLSGVENAGIVRLAARDGARAQVMVTVRNQSDRTAGTLRARFGGAVVEMPITLPARGGERDYFLDAATSPTNGARPRASDSVGSAPRTVRDNAHGTVRGADPTRIVEAPSGDVVEVELSPADALPVDNEAWLVRERSTPRLEPRYALPETLRRMVDIYEKSRPPRANSRAIALVKDFPDLPAGEPAVAIADPGVAATEPVTGPVTLVPHPITAELQAADFTGARVSARAPTAAGWQPIISIGGRPAVMVRSDPNPQVWVSFDSPTWGRTPAFVVFWTNVFDWIGGGGEAFASYPLTRWQPDWQPIDAQTPTAPGLWPGIYRGPAGEVRAFNTLDLRTAAPPSTAWEHRMHSLALSQPAGVHVAPYALLAAICLVLLAASTWQRFSRFVAKERFDGSH